VQFAVKVVFRIAVRSEWLRKKSISAEQMHCANANDCLVTFWRNLNKPSHFKAN